MLKRSTFILLAITMMTVSLADAFAFDQYAAISYSASTGRSGWSYDHVRLEDAQYAANNYCGVWDCRVLAWVRNGCAAVAVGWGTTHGWAWSTSRYDAISRALFECEGQGGGCQSLASVCTSGYGY